MKEILEAAKRTRTNSGKVDEQGLSTLFAWLPEVTAATPRALLEFANTLELPSEGSRIEDVVDKGLSGAPVYIIFDEAEQAIAAVKVFPFDFGNPFDYQSKLFAQSLSALARLGEADMSGLGFRAVKPLGVAKVMKSETAGHAILVMSMAQGKSFLEMLADVGMPSDKDRKIVLEQLEEAVKANAKALASLHNVGAGGQGSPDYVAQQISTLTGTYEWLKNLANDKGVKLLMGEDLASELEQLATKSLIDGFRNHPGSATFVHGDPNPGNFFYEPNEGITMIDIGSLHASMNAQGQPIASAAADVERFVGGLSRLGTLTGEEVDKLSQVFRQEYEKIIQREKITPQAQHFFCAMTALGDSFDPLMAEEPDRMAVDKLFKRVKEAFGGES
jgi:hypothetical protein